MKKARQGDFPCLAFSDFMAPSEPCVDHQIKDGEEVKGPLRCKRAARDRIPPPVVPTLLKGH